MIDDFVQDLHLLQTADALIGKIWLKNLACQFGLFVFAGLIAVFGLGMTNVAGFYALQASLGPVWAAVVVAIADFVLAAIIVLVARNSQPGPEMDQALDDRKTAIEAIHASARDLKVTIDAFGQEIRDAKDTIAGLFSIPATSIIKGLSSKKDQA
jgi:hypothetical protein